MGAFGPAFVKIIIKKARSMLPEATMTTRYLSLFNKIPIHIKRSRTKRLWPFACMGALLFAQQSAQAAKCEYIVSNEWNTGFVATIRITNDSATTINNWSVNWDYSDG